MLLAFLCVSFDRTWCEPPYPKYEPVLGHDLIQVHVMTRHGSRTPLHVSELAESHWICNNTEYFANSESASVPLKVHVANGDSIFLGNCHFGQLLGSGVDAVVRLGKYLRTIYVDSLKFLPSSFSSELTYFRSTSTHRTVHTTMSMLTGLYPGHHEVVIYTADKIYDIWRRGSQVCPNLKKKIEEIKAGEEFKKKFKAFKSPKLLDGDIAMSRRCSSLDLPTSVNSSQIDMAALAKAVQQSYVFSHSSVFKLAFSFPMSLMLNEMSTRIDGSNHKRFYHWSAHNGNVFSFMGYLGFQHSKLPAYGSYIQTELWKDRQNGEYKIRFIYNGEWLSIPRFENKKLVSFEFLRDFVIKNTPRLEEDCGFSRKRLSEASLIKVDEK